MAARLTAQQAHQRNIERAAKMKNRIEANIRRGAGAGIEAAGIFLAARVRDALNVVAPKRRTPGGWVATTRAVPGAPMRRVTGTARRSVYAQAYANQKAQLISVVGMNARSPKGFNYPKFHELSGSPRSGRHPVLRLVAEQYHDELVTIVGREVYGGFRTP